MKKLICLFLALLLLTACGKPAESATTAAPTTTVPVPTARTCEVVGEQVTFEPWEQDGIPTEGSYCLTRDVELTPLAAMTMLGCTTAAECTAGAVYATIIHVANFDEAMIVSVNHSGRSCAVGSIAGALLGARLGVEALPEFYLESLEPAQALTELAIDLTQAKQTLSIFDDSWDQKYVQGMPSH